MQLRIDQLPAHLERGRLARCYVVSGDEALLCLEAQDAIRRAARAQGYDEREVLHADARMDWSALERAAASQSLFCSRRLLEIRLPSGKPGKSGGAALQAHARREDEDLLTIISLPRLDRASRASDWASALQATTAWIEVAAIGRDRLPEWIAGRLARQRQSAPPPALAFLADQVEGNLLAAHQEIGKLHLLYGDGPLTLEQIRAAIFDVARFEGVSLPAAMLAGDRPRIARTVAGLRAEGEPLPLLLWIVSEELRNLLRLHQGVAAGRPFATVARTVRLGVPAALAERVLPRLDGGTLAALLGRCAQIDRLVKGLHVAGRDDDPWLELTEVALGLAPDAPSGAAARRPAAAAAGRAQPAGGWQQ